MTIRNIWKYTHVDFEKANQLIEEGDWTFLYNVSEINQAWELWQQTFMEIIEECIPKPSIPLENNIPWMQKHIKLKLKKRNGVYKMAKQT